MKKPIKNRKRRRNPLPPLPTPEELLNATARVRNVNGLGAPKTQIVDLKVIETLAAYGLTKEEIAANINMTYETFNERQKENPQIAETIKKGRAKILGEAGKQLAKKVTEGDMTAIIWLQKSLGGRSERSSIELTGPGGGPVAMKVVLSLEEQTRIAKEFILSQEAQPLVAPTREAEVIDLIDGNSSGL